MIESAIQASIEAAWKRHAQAVVELDHGPGSVFTPRETALRLAALTFEPLDEPPSLLDPACGAGALLLGAIEWAVSERPSWAEFWLTQGMEGWDTSSAAVCACNRMLGKLADDAGFQRQEFARVCDALNSVGQFDVVIANPPWVSYSGRHSRKITAARRAELASKFGAFAGWPALHTAFAEQCSRLARLRLGLLLPMQMADLPGYGAAREAVTARLNLQHSIDLGEDVFDGVTEPAGLFVFGAEVGSDRPWIADDNQGLLSAMRCFSPLPAESFGDVGVHTGNSARLIIGKESGRPLRVGRDIEAFRLAQPSHFLRELDLPDGHYARVSSEHRYRDAVIVLRQTATRPIAAPHEPWAYFRNSVLACYGAPGHDVDYLLGVLNSDMVADIHRAMFRDARQRTFPQLKIRHLRALPIPGREIGSVYERIANAARQCRSDNEQARLDLELLVRQAYGLVGN